MVTELQSAIQNEGEMTAPSRELAEFAQAKGPVSAVDAQQLISWAKDFVASRPPAVVIDIDNEFSCYAKFVPKPEPVEVVEEKKKREPTPIAEPKAEVRMEEEKAEGEKTKALTSLAGRSIALNALRPAKAPVLPLRLFGSESDHEATPSPSPIQDPFKEQLLKTIHMYEALMAQQLSQGQNPDHTMRLLETLKSQLKAYLAERPGASPAISQPSPSPEDGRGMLLNPEERRAQALDEIFHFYNRQHCYANGRKTFESLGEDINQMPLGYFAKMLKDFGIALEQSVSSFII